MTHYKVIFTTRKKKAFLCHDILKHELNWPISWHAFNIKQSFVFVVFAYMENSMFTSVMTYNTARLSTVENCCSASKVPLSLSFLDLFTFPIYIFYPPKFMSLMEWMEWNFWSHKAHIYTPEGSVATGIGTFDKLFDIEWRNKKQQQINFSTLLTEKKMQNEYECDWLVFGLNCRMKFYYQFSMYTKYEKHSSTDP